MNNFQFTNSLAHWKHPSPVDGSNIQNANKKIQQEIVMSKHS